MGYTFSITPGQASASTAVSTTLRVIGIVAALFMASACSRAAPAPASASREITAAVAGSGDPAVPEDKVPAIDACTLLDRSDVIRIFGSLRDEARPDRGLRGERDCRWRNEEGQWLKASLYGASRWELEKGLVSEMQPRPLAGAGDEAFSVKQGTDGVVHVRKGGAVIEVSCSCGIEKSESLARMAAAKL